MFNHISVLLEKSIALLNIKPDGVYVDLTAGGGGHSTLIAERLTTGRLICVDRDPDAIAACKSRFTDDGRITVVQSRFSRVRSVLEGLKVGAADGILLDLGVSSHQLDTAQRGFSFHSNAPLDMRMEQNGTTAAELINTLSAKELADIMFKYADEKFSYRIADEIVRRRAVMPIETTTQLASLVADCYPAKFKRDGHPARKTFQALRMAVNEELSEIKDGIVNGFDCLRNGGRMAVITFHSIEDRLVKQEFAALCSGCECPPDFPVCVCGKTPHAKRITGKPVTANRDELDKNIRSRSAKLRVIERIK